MRKILLGLVLATSLMSCTDNVRARHWGGTEKVELPPNHKFVNATWKESALWIISQDTLTGKIYMKEKSSLGLLEGTIEFK